jgi:hypothetical protein
MEEWKMEYYTIRQLQKEIKAKNLKVVRERWASYECKEDSLKRKTEFVAAFVKQLAHTDKINLDTHYVTFVNGKPKDGAAFDTIIISESVGQTNDVKGIIKWTITMYDRREQLNYNVYAVNENETKTLVFSNDERKQVLSWFNGPKTKKTVKEPKTIKQDEDLAQAMKQISKEIEDIINN